MRRNLHLSSMAAAMAMTAVTIAQSRQGVSTAAESGIPTSWKPSPDRQLFQVNTDPTSSFSPGGGSGDVSPQMTAVAQAVQNISVGGQASQASMRHKPGRSLIGQEAFA